MYYTNLRRLSILQGPRSLLNRGRRFSVQTGAIQPMSLSKRSALRTPSYSPQELHAMSSEDLKSLMKESGLRYAGVKSTLVDRATRYVYQHPTVPTSSSSRLHPHLSSSGQRATVQRKPATTASSVSKKSSSTRKPSAQIAQMKEIPHQEIFGHDHDFGTKLAARAHFEGSSLSWAAPAPAPPVPQPNMFSAAQKSTVASIKAKHATVLSKTTTTKTSTPAAHSANHSSASPVKVKEAKKEPMTTIKAAAHHADRSAKPTAQHNATITAGKSKINALAEAKEGYQTKISSFHLATPKKAELKTSAAMPKEDEVKSGAWALKKVEIKSGATTPSKVADSTRTTIRSAAAALQREKTTTSPSSPTSIFDLPKVAQPHLEKQIFQASESAPKKTVQPPTSTSFTHTKPVMSAKAIAASTGGASTSAKVSSSSSSSSGGMGRNEIKQTSHAEASSSSSTPPKSSSSASSSESKTGSSSSSSSSSSSNKKAESSDGWSSDKIPASTSAFPALLGLGVIAWFIAGKRDRFLEAEARKREEERRLHSKRRLQINESAEEVVLL